MTYFVTISGPITAFGNTGNPAFGAALVQSALFGRGVAGAISQGI